MHLSKAVSLTLLITLFYVHWRMQFLSYAGKTQPLQSDQQNQHQHEQANHMFIYFDENCLTKPIGSSENDVHASINLLIVLQMDS